jgi:hypothetical protein
MIDYLILLELNPKKVIYEKDIFNAYNAFYF